MSFLTETLGEAKPTSFLDSVSEATPQSVKEANYAAEAFNARQESDQANSFKGTVHNIISTIKDNLPGITPKSLDLRKGLDIASQEQFKTYKDTVDRFENVGQVFRDHKSVLEKGAALGSAGIGVINSLFTAVTAPLKLISTVPVVGYAGDVVNNVFALLGQGGSTSFGAAVDGLPISEQSKAAIRPLAEEVGALGAMIIAGKAGEEAYTNFRDKSASLVDKVIDETGKANPAAMAPSPSNNFEPAVKGGFLDSVKTPEAAPIVEGDQNVSRTSLKIQEEARARALTNEFPDVPFIEKMKLAEEAIKADELVKTNPDQAREVLNRPVVEVRDQSVFNALKRKAFAEGDVALIQDLAKSKIGTEAAQNLKALDDGFRLDADPVEALKEVALAREKASVKNSTREKVVAKEKAVLPKVEKVKPANWDEFIDNITC